MKQDGAAKQKSKLDLESEVVEDYMVKHVREMIHRVGSYERFNKILKRAIASEISLNDL
jgi:uncharacterized protein (DUF924 family)